jgi:hypothetical protein
MNRMYLMAMLCCVAFSLVACSTVLKAPTPMAPPEPARPAASNENPVLPWSATEVMAPNVDLVASSHNNVVSQAQSAYIMDQFNYELYREGRDSHFIATGVVRGGKLTVQWDSNAPKHPGNVYIVYSRIENDKEVFLNGGRGLPASIGAESGQVAEGLRAQARYEAAAVAAATNTKEIAKHAEQLKAHTDQLSALGARADSLQSQIEDALRKANAGSERIKEIMGILIKKGYVEGDDTELPSGIDG